MPAVRTVTVAALTVQMVAVVLAKMTGLPDAPAVAVRVRVAPAA